LILAELLVALLAPVFGLIIGVLAAIDPMLRFALGQVEAKTGYAVTYARASGNLQTGQLELAGAGVSRHADEGLTMELQIEGFSLDLALLSLLSGTPRIEDLAVSGVSGTIVTPPKNEGQVANKPRRSFTVEAGRFDRIDLSVGHQQANAHRIEIASADETPFRSDMALFDLFFRSNLDGRIDGVPLRIATNVIAGNGRSTEWAFDTAPAATLAGLTERAPLNWLSEGTISTHVTDEWRLDDRAVSMNWSIALDGVRVAAPAGAGVAQRVTAGALAKAAAAQGGSAPFDFTLTLDKERLETSSSGDLDAL
jgi:hypothetical protein